MAKKKSVRYPWDKWFGWKRCKLVRGKDYHCQPHSMSVQIRNAAIQRGLRVKVEIDEGTITVIKQGSKPKKKRKPRRKR